MLARMHNRRICSEAADLNLRGSREGPQKRATATRRKMVKVVEPPVRDKQGQRYACFPTNGCSQCRIQEAGCSGMRRAERH